MDYKKYNRFRDYNNYIIFSNGKIFSLYRNRFLKATLDNNYYNIKLSNNNNNKQKKYKLHRILAECFLENPHNLPTIDHIDKNSLNNDLSNLRFASRELQSINRNRPKNNKSGIKGVIFDKKQNRYIAYYYKNKKQHSKSFKLDYYKNAKELAINYRKEMVEKYYKNII